MKSFRSLIIMVALLLPAAVVASGEEIRQLSFSEAVEKGVAQNNLLKGANFRADAARIGASAASLHYLPTLSFEESWSRSNLPVNSFMMKLNQGRFTNQDFAMDRLNNPAPVSDFRTAVTIEQPILAVGAWAAKNAAESAAAQQTAVAAATREQVAFLVFRSYLAVQKGHARVKAAEKGVEEAQESIRQARVRSAAGLGLKSDKLRAATHLAAMEQQLISANNSLTLARLQLGLAVGGESGEQYELKGFLDLEPPRYQLDKLLEMADLQRQDMKSTRYGKEQAEAALWQVRSGFLPTVGAVGSWQMNDRNSPFGNDRDAWLVGVTLRWNIFDRLQGYHGSRQAKALHAAASEQVEQSRKEVAYQVREAWFRLQEARKRNEVASSAMQLAEEANRLLSRRFENALANMVELLDARTALNQARANQVESEAELTFATGNLYYSAGIFLKEVR